MGSLSTVEAKLPPGFRFHPRDDELICDYLMKKLTCCECSLLIEVDLNKCEPWDIPEIACVGGKECYFYSQRDRKYATGLRTNRATVSGYWKATGKDKTIFCRGAIVGMRKTLVFYQGRPPKGRKSNWVMHEFRLQEPHLSPPVVSLVKEDWVLCRVFNKDREVAAKQGMGSGYDDTSSSPSLPPLMDDSYITFDQPHQTHITNGSQYEQVPCFSNIFTPSQIHPTFSPITHMDPNIPTKITTPTSFGGNGMPELSPFSCDKSVVEVVLNQLTKMDSMKSPSLGEGLTSESFLSDVDFPTMWGHY